MLMYHYSPDRSAGLAVAAACANAIKQFRTPGTGESPLVRSGSLPSFTNIFGCDWTARAITSKWSFVVEDVSGVMACHTSGRDLIPVIGLSGDS